MTVSQRVRLSVWATMQFPVKPTPIGHRRWRSKSFLWKRRRKSRGGGELDRGFSIDVRLDNLTAFHGNSSGCLELASRLYSFQPAIVRKFARGKRASIWSRTRTNPFRAVTENAADKLNFCQTQTDNRRVCIYGICFFEAVRTTRTTFFLSFFFDVSRW